MSTARIGLVLTLATPLAVVAQEPSVQIGLVGGVNRNTMTGVGPVNAEFAGQAGLYGQFRLGSRVSFRPEMSVSWKRVGTGGSPIPCDPGPCPLATQLNYIPNDQTTNLSWLEVPLLAQVTLPQIGSGITPRLIGGPYVAVRLSCSVSGVPTVTYDVPAAESGAPATVTQSCADANPWGVGNGDAGFVLGAGVGIRQFGVGLRWTRSLVATVPFSPFSNSPLMGGKQSTLAITIDMAIR